MCLDSLFGKKEAAAPAPTVDPEAERRAAEAEAAKLANQKTVDDARRKRTQAGVVATGDEYGGSVLAAAKPASDKQKTSSTVLAGGA